MYIIHITGLFKSVYHGFIQVFSSFTQPFPWFVAAEFRTFAPAVWAVTPGASPGAPREEEST